MEGPAPNAQKKFLSLKPGYLLAPLSPQHPRGHYKTFAEKFSTRNMPQTHFFLYCFICLCQTTFSTGIICLHNGPKAFTDIPQVYKDLFIHFLLACFILLSNTLCDWTKPYETRHPRHTKQKINFSQKALPVNCNLHVCCCVIVKSNEREVPSPAHHGIEENSLRHSRYRESLNLQSMGSKHICRNSVAKALYN